MPKPTKGPRLGGSAAHQRLILANLATQLFEHGRITTTEAKARRLRPYAEKLITKAKKGDLHNRREVLKTVRDKSVVHVLFTEIAPTFAERPGGYTRITKIGPRKGDNAPMAVIELVTEEYTPAPPATERAATKSAAKKAAPAQEPADTEGTDVATTGPTSLEEEASMDESVIAEEQPVADEAEGSDLTVEPAPGSDDPAADAAAEESAGETEAVDEPTGDDDKS